jgi:hypothetical protein
MSVSNDQSVSIRSLVWLCFQAGFRVKSIYSRCGTFERASVLNQSCFPLFSHVSLCREHGQQLSELMAPNVTLMGVVKETGVDDVGLLEFYQKFFMFPIYQDSERKLYESFGNRKIALRTWNPIKIVKGYFELKGRIGEKQIQGNLVGEGMVQGGVMVFNKEGILHYAQQEEIGNELDMEAIRAAIDELLMEKVLHEEL